MRTLTAVFVLICVTIAENSFAQAPIRDAVVKIHTTRRPPDFVRPWSKSRPQQISGTGAVIAGQRILTNAHVVSYASRIYVQANQSSQRKPASVVAIAPEMDLAVITVDDKEFFAGRPTLELASDMPKLKDAVNVYGYPIGGQQMSITEGIVSRIEAAAYVLDGFGLRIQVDAALNPGNSGGPAIANGKILGLVVSGIRNAENIGYLIPAEEIQTFLEDVADGTYDGKLRLFGRFQTVENEALRHKLKLDPHQGGMMVTEPIREDDTYPLREFDVITHVGDYELDRQGKIQVQQDLKLTFHYAVPKLAKHGSVPLRILRAGETLSVEVPVTAHRDRLIRPLRGKYPSHFIYGPMLFTAASQDLLTRLRGAGATVLSLRDSPLFKRSRDKPAFPGEELVILGSRLFPHRIAEGYDPQFFAVVSDVNGLKVKNLTHLVEVLRDTEDEFVVLRLAGSYETLAFRRDELAAATEEILEDEGIRYQFSDDLKQIWQGAN